MERHIPKLLLFSFIAFLLLFFVGCVSQNDMIAEVGQETAVIPPSPTLSPVTVTSTSTPMPTFTPEPTATMVLPTSTPDTTCLFEPQTLLSDSEPLEDVVLFLSKGPSSWTRMEVFSDTLRFAYRNSMYLWGVSANGQRVNRLTNDERGVAWYVPEGSGLPLRLMSVNNLIVDESMIWQIPLPLECDGFLEDRDRDIPSCGDFEISPDGKWASFVFGDYLGGWETQSGLINLETKETHFPLGLGIYRFLPNDEYLAGISWGEGGETWWANSLTGEARRLGDAGFVYWNEDETAFANEWFPYTGIGGAIWAYDLPTKSLFEAESGLDIMTTYPVWQPDGLLLYHQNSITHGENGTSVLGPRQVRLANIVTGDDRMILGDPQSNYFLCEDSHPEDCVWAGDWIRVRRVQYEKRPLQRDEYDGCVLYGNCGDAVENLAYNWRTGEIGAWEDVAHLLPTPTIEPIPSVVMPDLTVSPLYENAEMGYALYPGDDGRSIWCVPETGVAQLWVQDAEWFAYLP